MKYSILVPTNNGIHYTECCLTSLLHDVRAEAIPLSHFEIIILDNDSIDGIYELIDYFNGVNLRYYKFDREERNPAKMNYGAGEASGEYLIFLDNHTEVIESLITPMEDALNDESIGIVSGLKFAPDGRIDHAGLALDANNIPIRLFSSHHENREKPITSQKVPAVSTFCTMVRRNEFLRLNGFDNSLAGFYSDVDLCLQYQSTLKKSAFVTAKSRSYLVSLSVTEEKDNEWKEYFLSKWPNPADYISNIYDSRAKKNNLLKDEKLRAKPTEDKKEMHRTSTGYSYKKRETIVFFFDDSFSAFNVSIENLYKAYKSKYSKAYKVCRDSPSNFFHYHNADCWTVTYTHFWPDYFRPTRHCAQKDLRLFAVNYETTIKPRDYWMDHIRNNDFRILYVSHYCRHFLKNAGIPNERLLYLPLGYCPKIRKPRKNRPGYRMNYLTITNSNDPDRYNTETIVEAFASAFSTKKNKVGFIVKDCGSEPSITRQLLDRHLQGFSVSLEGFISSERRYVKLFRDSDIFISPIRGEGFGMKTLEAAVSGLPVIGPRYGGPKDYLHYAEFVEVAHTLKPVGNTIDRKYLLFDQSYVDCNMDVESLKSKLLETYSGACELRTGARKKRAYLLRAYSWSTIAAALEKHLQGTDFEAREITQKMSGDCKNEYEFAASETYAQNEIEYPDISVLINTYNRAESLFEVITAFLNLPDTKSCKTEIIIVDDGSKEEYLPLLKELNQNHVALRYIKYNMNKGSMFAKNVALHHARGEISVFVGDDIIPLPGFLTRRLTAHRRYNATVLILGHTEWHPSVRNNMISLYSTKYSGFQFGYHFIRHKSEASLRNLYTSNISFVTAAIKTRGLYFKCLEGINLYDDTLWGDQLKVHGFRLIYDREIEALHKHHTDYKWFINRAYNKGRTAMQLYTKYPNSADFTKVEVILEEIRNLYPDTISSSTDLFLLESMMKEEHLLYENRLKIMKGYYERLKLMQIAAHILSRVHDYYQLKGVLSAFTLDEHTKNAILSECFFQHSTKSKGQQVSSTLSVETRAVCKLILHLAGKLKKIHSYTAYTKN